MSGGRASGRSKSYRSNEGLERFLQNGSGQVNVMRLVYV